MTRSSPVRMVRLVTRAYDCFLGLYPPDFRGQFAQEMRDQFEERCLEAYRTAGTTGVGRWLLKILVGEAVSLYKEYVNMTVDLNRGARNTLSLGLIFLAGTWMTLFFLAAGFMGGLAPGVILVLANALLTARAFLCSERMEYVTGMAGMANTFLSAGLMAVQSSLGSFPIVAYGMQAALIGLHGLLLWRLRGEDLTDEQLAFQKGE